MTRQSGLSVVEMIITLAVTAILLSGLVSVVHGSDSLYRQWSGAVVRASNLDLLAPALQSDSERYAVCSLQDMPYEITFCFPTSAESISVNEHGLLVIWYHVQGVDLVRDQLDVPVRETSSRTTWRVRESRTLLRGLSRPPAFSATCDLGGAVASGVITVRGISFNREADARPPVAVFYRAPSGGGCDSKP